MTLYIESPNEGAAYGLPVCLNSPCSYTALMDQNSISVSPANTRGRDVDILILPDVAYWLVSSFILPGVLEMLNSLLSAGELPGLFSSEELAKELAAVDTKRDKDTHYQVTKMLCVYAVAACKFAFHQ